MHRTEVIDKSDKQKITMRIRQIIYRKKDRKRNDWKIYIFTFFRFTNMAVNFKFIYWV